MRSKRKYEFEADKIIEVVANLKQVKVPLTLQELIPKTERVEMEKLAGNVFTNRIIIKRLKLKLKALNNQDKAKAEELKLAIQFGERDVNATMNTLQGMHHKTNYVGKIFKTGVPGEYVATIKIKDAKSNKLFAIEIAGDKGSKPEDVMSRFFPLSYKYSEFLAELIRKLNQGKMKNDPLDIGGIFLHHGKFSFSSAPFRNDKVWHGLPSLAIHRRNALINYNFAKRDFRTFRGKWDAYPVIVTDRVIKTADLDVIKNTITAIAHEWEGDKTFGAVLRHKHDMLNPSYLGAVLAHEIGHSAGYRAKPGDEFMYEVKTADGNKKIPDKTHSATVGNLMHVYPGTEADEIWARNFKKFYLKYKLIK